MNLLADESVDQQIDRLRQDGHNVLYIAEAEPSISDDLVFDRANEMVALLVTEDKDFGEIVFRDSRLSSGGVVLLRLAGLSPERKAEVVSEAFLENERELPSHFSVISPGKIRIRPKDSDY
jgi:predicted nuclease of predicted toxin-antitoxin system